MKYQVGQTVQSNGWDTNYYILGISDYGYIVRTDSTQNSYELEQSMFERTTH